LDENIQPAIATVSQTLVELSMKYFNYEFPLPHDWLLERPQTHRVVAYTHFGGWTVTVNGGNSDLIRSMEQQLDFDVYTSKTVYFIPDNVFFNPNHWSA
jgi:hypothetical protein